jgi:hypothetical protein
MMILTNGSDIGDFCRAVFSERLDMMELDLGFIFDRMIIDKAIEHAVSTLLGEDLLLLSVV